jgi:hypothetical protein
MSTSLVRYVEPAYLSPRSCPRLQGRGGSVLGLQSRLDYVQAIDELDDAIGGRRDELQATTGPPDGMENANVAPGVPTFGSAHRRP